MVARVSGCMSEVGRAMKQVHTGFEIGEAVTGNHMIGTLTKFDVSARERNEVMAIMAGAKGDIVGQQRSGLAWPRQRGYAGRMAHGTPEIRFGIGTVARGGGQAVAVVVSDRVALLADILARRGPPGGVAPLMRDFIADWDRWHGWLRGLDLNPDREEGWAALDAFKWMAPVPEPWNIFSTYHNYTRPSRVTGRSDPPKAERILPDIFFGSRSSLAGYGETVYREHGGHQFDFEVEITPIIGRPATRVKAEQAEDHIAGYAIANDLTMHHAWWRPIRDKSPINDNIRMKNFPGYTPVSRVIVPRDLAGDVHDLGVKAWVGGQLRQDTRTTKILWRMGELIEYLSHIMTLRPGDMILSGSPEELPLPEGATRGILPGQTVVCEVENLGRLENPVAEQPFRQPYEP